MIVRGLGSRWVVVVLCFPSTTQLRSQSMSVQRICLASPGRHPVQARKYTNRRREGVVLRTILTNSLGFHSRRRESRVIGRLASGFFSTSSKRTPQLKSRFMHL